MKATLHCAVTCSLLLSALVLFPLTAAATEVGPGPVYGHWYASGNPYNVNGEIYVPSESTLVIDSSVVVVFQGHYKFRVDSLATLIAVGSPTDSIIFTAADTSTGWHGIRFYWASDSSQLSYCRIEYGRATGRGEASGGAILCDQSSPTISDNTIRSNNADWDGGGIVCYSCSPTISGNIISGNSASNGNGGGIYCHYSSPTISANTISGNSAGYGGGICCHDGSSPMIRGNTIIDNSARSSGGGIHCINASPTMGNNTIADNTSNGTGGGINSAGSSCPIILNTVVWGNEAPSHAGVFDGGNCISLSYSDIQDTLWPGQGNTSTDPLFRDPANMDYHLQSISNPNCGGPGDSPCIDAGHPDSLDVILDCFHGLGTYRADMGAYGWGGVELPLTLTIAPGDTVVAHNDTLCYHVICENHTPNYQSLSFKVNVRLPNGNMYGPIFGPARFGMFGNGISEGDMCHRVPPKAPIGDYWLFAEVYNLEVSARDSMAFTVTGDGALPASEPWPGDWQTVVARIGDNDFIGDGVAMAVPTEFALGGNYPNPFNASTVIAYQLPTSSHVTLEVFNLLGRRVTTLVDEKQEAGYRSIVWNASEISSGLYFYKLTAGEFTETRRMMLVK